MGDGGSFWFLLSSVCKSKCVHKKVRNHRHSIVIFQMFQKNTHAMEYKCTNNIYAVDDSWHFLKISLPNIKRVFVKEMLGKSVALFFQMVG